MIRAPLVALSPKMKMPRSLVDMAPLFYKDKSLNKSRFAPEAA
jgi:hypothetical protein